MQRCNNIGTSKKGEGSIYNETVRTEGSYFVIRHEGLNLLPLVADDLHTGRDPLRLKQPGRLLTRLLYALAERFYCQWQGFCYPWNVYKTQIRIPERDFSFGF